VLSLSSCYSIKYAQESQILSQAEIAEDITFLKRKLSSRHYNLNWEGRKDLILSSLDSVTANHNEITTAFFLYKIEPVLETVDDGHTTGFMFQKADKDKLKRAPNNFSCLDLDSETMLLKIPDFYDKSGLTESLTLFDSLIMRPDISTLIVDLRNNHGGKINLVRRFLGQVLIQNTRLCDGWQMRATIDMLHPVNMIFLILRGYKKSGKHIIKKGPIVKSRGSFDIKNKYVLVDSTIISGSMLAVYHLKKAGYTVVGSNPTSLFNSFGNSAAINLPNSHLYVGISTARVIVDKNHTDRSADMLYCDIPIKGESLEQILQIIRQRGARLE
jgi:hypothetical protein